MHRHITRNWLNYEIPQLSKWKETISDLQELINNRIRIIPKLFEMRWKNTDRTTIRQKWTMLQIISHAENKYVEKKIKPLFSYLSINLGTLRRVMNRIVSMFPLWDRSRQEPPIHF